MTTCNVSVVIPAYNAESFVIDALESVARQSLLPKEVIIINDGSTDKTFDVVQAWIVARDNGCPIHLFSQKNKGLPATRNFGIEQAKGKWIALLDADDIWESCHLAELLNALNVESSAVAAYGAGRLLVGTSVNDVLYDDFWDNPSKKFGKKIDSSPYQVIEKNIFTRLIHGNFIKPSSLIFSKEVAANIGLFDETLRTGEDREFLVRLIFEGNFVYIPVPITQYRWHDDNISQSKNAKRNMENGLRALKKITSNSKLKLTDEQKLACLNEVRSAVSGYLYVCAKSGFKDYINGFKVVNELFDQRTAVVAFNAKHLAHCIRSTLKN